MLTALPRPTTRHRHSGGRRPPKSLRAAFEKAEAQSLQLVDKTPRRDETQDGERGYRDLSAIRWCRRSAAARDPGAQMARGASRRVHPGGLVSHRDEPDGLDGGGKPRRSLIG